MLILLGREALMKIPMVYFGSIS